MSSKLQTACTTPGKTAWFARLKYQNPPPTTSGYAICLYMSIYVYVWLYDYFWLNMIIYDYILSYLVLFDYIWSYLVLFDYIWLYLIIFSPIWLYMIIFAYLWLYMFIFNSLKIYKVYDYIKICEKYDYIWLFLIIHILVAMYNYISTYTHTTEWVYKPGLSTYLLKLLFLSCFFSPVTTWQRSVLISDPQIERWCCGRGWMLARWTSIMWRT